MRSAMPRVLVAYAVYVSRFNRLVGRIVMYGVFAMIAVLLYSSLAKAFWVPPLWTLEVSQFMMVAYFLLGGAYSMLMDSHVRMDLLYGAWSARTRTITDVITVLFLLFYLGLLLYGGVSSTSYALEYGERSYSSWRPYMAPVKIVMVVGIVLMLAQTLAILIRDVARLLGEEIDLGLNPGEAET